MFSTQYWLKLHIRAVFVFLHGKAKPTCIYICIFNYGTRNYILIVFSVDIVRISLKQSVIHKILNKPVSLGDSYIKMINCSSTESIALNK